MKRISYTDEYGTHIVTPTPKESVERVLGPLTDDEYWAHVYQVSVPLGATDVTEID